VSGFWQIRVVNKRVAQHLRRPLRKDYLIPRRVDSWTSLTNSSLVKTRPKSGRRSCIITASNSEQPPRIPSPSQ
jgi:hypothetical protein